MESRRSRFMDPFFSLVVFSVYAGLMGAVLLFGPRLVLPLFKVREEVNAYTYMLGFVLLCSAFYYSMSGLARNRHFARLTTYTRFASPIVTAVLFVAAQVPVNFLPLSIVDGLGGLWTFMALRRADVPAAA